MANTDDVWLRERRVYPPVFRASQVSNTNIAMVSTCFPCGERPEFETMREAEEDW